MFCSKCGKEIPSGSGFCNSCGTPVKEQGVKGSGQSQWASALSMLIKLDPVLAIIPVGSFFLILGAFLPWYTAGGRFFSATTLGLQMPSGAVIAALGVLFLVVLILSRTGTPGSWGIVMLLISALALALIFQTMYHLLDSDVSVGAGLYLAMVGGLVTTVASAIEYTRTRKQK